MGDLCAGAEVVDDPLKLLRMDSALLLLAAYAVAIAAAWLAGGWLSSVLGDSHTRTQIVMSLVAGLILGVALYHMLPHGVARLQGPSAVATAAWWAVLGVVLMVLLLRVVDFHQHDFSSDAPASHAHSSSWLGIAGGLSVHSVVEGVALGTSVLALEQLAGGLTFASAGAFLAILLHKPLEALSIVSVMRGAGASARLRLAANAVFALLCPASALLTFWGAGLLGAHQDAVVGRALALSAGAFLCISLSDLLPETQFHRHDRGKLAVAFLAGIGLAYVLHLLEAGAHGH